MKFTIYLLLTMVIVIAAGLPLEERANRQRRVTCDLLGFTGDSACAANCISMGKAGGTCHNGICICRQDTMKELLDKRFPRPPDMIMPGDEIIPKMPRIPGSKIPELPTGW